MSIQVYLGHTGQRLSFDPSITDLEALRAWIAQQASIQPRNQILLTAQGKQVRNQTLLTENELFVFDSSRLTAKNDASSPSSSGLGSSTSSDYSPGVPPETVTNPNDLQSWQMLFRAHKNWAGALLNGCDNRANQAAKLREEQAIIERSLGVAVASLHGHVKSAQQKYTEAEVWAEDLLQHQHAHLENWEQHLEKMRSVPARAEFSRFIRPSHQPPRRGSQQSASSTMQGFVDVEATRKAASSAQSIMGSFAKQVTTMRENLNSVMTDSDRLLKAVEQINAQSSASNSLEPSQLIEEIQLVVQKLAADFEHVQSLPRSPHSVSQASKSALLHSRQHIPSLNEMCREVNELVHRSRRDRDSTADIALDHMRTLSQIESQLSEVYASLKRLEVPQDDQNAFATLGVVSRLPAVYGLLLVESVRRREWVAKMKRDSATLQEEVATYQEEEDKRRKKWIRSVEDVVNVEALHSSVLGIELNLQNEGGSWPFVTREELSEYLKILIQVFGGGPVSEEVDQAIKDLDKPTRKQIKHARAFKNGSMHEAAFGDTSLLLRGDEQQKALKDQNARLEEELRAQKSRVRKLEDVLHRQSQASRVSAGDIFTPPNGSLFDRTATPPASATPRESSEVSRTNSLKKRRPSANQGTEEKKLARRIVDLEAELQAAKDEARERRSSDAAAQKQVEEAISTKNDLMQNMDAQKREFADERRALEIELADAKERVEEVENEIERLLGSRDDERTGVDARIVAFEEEIVRLKEDAAMHAARAATEHDARNALEEKLALAESTRDNAEVEFRKMQTEREQRHESEAEQLQLLTTAYRHLQDDLSQDSDTPDGISAISTAIERLARRSSAHVKDLAEAVAFAKSENKSLTVTNERQKKELANAAQKQAETESQITAGESKLAVAQARAASLESQLAEEQEQLKVLRTKFAQGETDSDVLRQQLEEEESKAHKLFSELAEAKSHINSLDIELMRMQKKHDAYHRTAEATSERLEKRAVRAKEVSQRLHAQNARLSRLLMRLGLIVSYQDDAMVIERASKVGASLSLPNPRDDLNRTTSLTSPPPTRKSSAADEIPDLAAVRWADAVTADDEKVQFELFLQHVSRFNLDTFGDAVVKRLRDYEYTAKKYIKEAKESAKRADGYKERSVKLKSEAHGKIAVKDFKEGDLALFLPTRGPVQGAWAAFNIGCPHYFLAEKDGMRLSSRDFIVVRILKIEQKVVDLSRTVSQSSDRRSVDERKDPSPLEDDNPFDLSDGLTWWMVHAIEERGAGGAPTTPGLGKSTVAAANVDAKGSIRVNKGSKSDNASKHLNKSLDSRRSSSTSKKSVAGAAAIGAVSAATAGSPTLAVTSDGMSAHQRSASQTSLKPPPTPTGASGAPQFSPGLGIITDYHDTAQPQHDQMSKLVREGPEFRSDSPSRSPSKARSQSPSKSVRSLQRHLERPSSASASPAKSPMSPPKSPVKKGGVWESLWQAEFSIESPSKLDK